MDEEKKGKNVKKEKNIIMPLFTLKISDRGDLFLYLNPLFFANIFLIQ